MKTSIALLLLALSPYSTFASHSSVRGSERRLKKGSKKSQSGGKKSAKGSAKGGGKKDGKKDGGKKDKGGDAPVFSTRRPPSGENICEGAGDPRFPNIPCFDDDGGLVAGGQAGANVTAGYIGGIESDHEPLTVPYYQAGLCPVNGKLDCFCLITNPFPFLLIR